MFSTQHFFTSIKQVIEQSLRVNWTRIRMKISRERNRSVRLTMTKGLLKRGQTTIWLWMLHYYYYHSLNKTSLHLIMEKVLESRMLRRDMLLLLKRNCASKRLLTPSFIIHQTYIYMCILSFPNLITRESTRVVVFDRDGWQTTEYRM